MTCEHSPQAPVAEDQRASQDDLKDCRLEIATRILAGFAANPAIFAANDQCGWSLVNCKDCELAGYAWKLANELVLAHKELAR